MYERYTEGWGIQYFVTAYPRLDNNFHMFYLAYTATTPPAWQLAHNPNTSQDSTKYSGNVLIPSSWLMLSLAGNKTMESKAMEGLADGLHATLAAQNIHEYFRSAEFIRLFWLEALTNQQRLFLLL